jgi:type II secretory pathway component PulC
MNAMSLRSTSSRARAAVLAVAVLLATATASGLVSAAEVEKKDAQSQADTERRLEDARRRLDAAAREVAELSMSMSEHAVPSIRLTRMGVPRAMLGINLGPRGGEESGEGVKIASVSPGGAAESAGLKAGDVLLEIGDKKLKAESDLSAREVLMQAMGEVKPGDKVKLRYRRDKKEATATVIAEPPMDRFFTRPMAVRGMAGSIATNPFPPPLALMRAVGVFGSAELVPLTPKLGQYFGAEKGLLVVRAPADSRLKLEDGDVIVDIDGRTPTSPTHAFRILGSYQAGEQLKLGVLRMKKRMTFDVTIPDDPAATAAAPFNFSFHHDGDIMRAPAIGIRGHDEIILSPAQPAMPLPPPPPPGEFGETQLIRQHIDDEPA